MAKSRPIFECQACGHKSSKWMGKCPNCGGWDSFLELSETQKKVLESSALSLNENAQALPITEVQEETITRFERVFKEFGVV
jgi:DNA repair protein RadA/Sms